MKLQIALDEVTIEQGLLLCEQVREQIDIIEIGTPVLVREGLHAVRAFREHFPEKEILADAKIMDAGEWEAKMCFEAGADYVTVLAVTDLLTIKECVKTAKEFGKQIVDAFAGFEADQSIREAIHCFRRRRYRRGYCGAVPACRGGCRDCGRGNCPCGRSG